MYIYIDILIITNIYANFFMLKATSRLTHSPIKNGRCILSAAAGSLFSLIILLPELNPLALLAFRIFSAALMVYLAFRGKTSAELYRTGLIFFFVCFLFAGTGYAFSLIDKGSNVMWHNSVLYVNISLLTLVVSTAAAYGALWLLRYFLDRDNSYDGDYSLIIIKGKHQITVKAICDSGNNLIDSFSGKHVIVCSKESIAPLFEEPVLEYAMSCTVPMDRSGAEAMKGWRIIPYSTVGNNGLMPSFLPTGVYLKNNETGRLKYIEAYIGVSDNQLNHAVFNPKILGSD